MSVERTDQRTRVFMRGALYTPRGAATVWIRDISGEGALIQADEPIDPDCDVIFKRGPIFVAAFVSWAKGHNAGIQFYRPLDDELLQSAHIPLPHRDD